MENSTIRGLRASIEANLGKLPVSSLRRCIYRVPKSLREVNEGAYTPMAVWIGPLHYMDESLVAMEVHKLKYLQSFLRDCRSNTDLSTYLRVVKDKETQLRENYADSTVHISSEKFTRMILIDSVFIIQLFRTHSNCSLINHADDHVCGRPFIFNLVMRDIQLAENQLPFFILKDLYWTAFIPQESNVVVRLFTDLACEFLNVKKPKICIDPTTNEAECCHLLDLVRSVCQPPDETNTRYGESMLFPSAMSLYEAGVQFQVAKSNTSNWLDVHFDKNKGVLTIPKLQVMDKPESYFRNLVAFEQCHYINYSTTYISDYQCFLDCLINTPEDVKVLAKECIIENWLGSDKCVSVLVNSLGTNVICGHKYYYGGISDQLNDHCSKRWNRYKATLNHTYFRHPWAVISVIYAAILLILTAIQVVSGILAVPSVLTKK